MGTPAKSKNLTIRTHDVEYQKIKEIADFNGQTLSEFVLNSVWARIEDYEDLREIEEWKNSEDKTRYSLEEATKILGF
ncbi:MAG: DUF1778 domain-containing protein [Actinomycetes bacterium]|jgi:uncharacterized protein (DUF1778 family)|nr:DUF1778 domain-containing protein [Actinomycetes bacterium]